MKRVLSLLFILSTFLAVFSGCSVGRRPPTPVGVVPIAKQISSSERQSLEQLKQEVFLHTKLWNNRRQHQRVVEITARLLGQVQTQERWEVYLLDDASWNAFTIHNAIFVFRGLLEDLRDDNEVAAVLAHEIGHNLARHSEPSIGEMFNKLLSAGLAVGAGALVQRDGGSAEKAQDIAALAKLFGDGFLVNPFSQADEHEADQIGIFLMADAGFDPAAAANVWERQSRKGGNIPEFFSTHPSPANRSTTLRQLLSRAEPRYTSARGKKLQRYTNIYAPTEVNYPNAQDEAAKLAALAGSYATQGRHREAAQLFAKAYQYQPQNLDYALGLGVSLHMLGYHQEAFGLYSRIVQSRPDALSYYNMACLYSVYARSNEALTALARAISLDGRFRQLAREDRDFLNIQGDPRFRRLVLGY